MTFFRICFILYIKIKYSQCVLVVTFAIATVQYRILLYTVAGILLEITPTGIGWIVVTWHSNLKVSAGHWSMTSKTILFDQEMSLLANHSWLVIF